MGYILTDTIPAYELVADVTVSVATTSVTIGGLNFGKADDLLLVTFLTGGITGTNIYLTYNGNSTLTNYYAQLLSGDGSVVGGSRQNTPLLGNVKDATNQNMLFNSKIKLSNSGYIVSQTSENVEFPSSSYTMLRHVYETSTFTASAINSLTIATANANSILVGSRFQLYKRKATLIADTTISGSAVTSVDFTGLNIRAGNEVMLVSDIVSATTTGSIRLFFNNNTTESNYYIQEIYANGSSISSVRNNTSFIQYRAGNTKGLSFINIKLTNSGYATFQSNTVDIYGGSSICLESDYNTTTFTMSSITSMHIVSANANVIQPNSRFQLYLLK